MKPLIGITPSPVTDKLPHGTFERYAMATTYVNAVLTVGGVPIVLPPQAGNTEAILDHLDGLLLSGGGDVEPSRFGDTYVHPATYGLHPLRDQFEEELVAGALSRDLPLLCVCRGIQVLNVTLGGTLIQDLADQHGPEIEHRQQLLKLPGDAIGHTIEAAPESILERLYKSTVVGVNSFHHQAIKTLAPGLSIVGTAPDGVIEAVSLPDRHFVLGVQWHPEIMFKRHPEQLAPFAALVEAALAAKREPIPA
ncbi:MAG: gamma-glutamyl-gamma-aminobutyrate hydrolase family protein [Chloroflexota bacterium]|nr:gamma-glutamyl-gamma-aminobutyrate hydrolase family protein [Chloroflexota bacterium]